MVASLEADIGYRKVPQILSLILYISIHTTNNADDEE